jgi:hypothetical protein
MERELCTEGTRLDTIYIQSVGECASAVAAKRAFADVPKGESSVADGQRLSQRVEDAKSARAKAQWAFIDHVVDCSSCKAPRSS